MELEFLDLGSAWNTTLNNTSAYLKKGNKMLLIDCGETVARTIISNKLLEDINQLYILVTHTHSDHIGSIGTLLFYSKYNKKIDNYIVVPDDVLFKKNIKDYLRIVDIDNEIEFINKDCFIKQFNFEDLVFLKANHVLSLPCYSFIIKEKNKMIYYSGDNSNIDLIVDILKNEDAKIYTEISNNPNLSNEHLYLKNLKQKVNQKDKKRIYLMHIDEFLSIDELENMGYNIPKIRKR